MPFYSFTFVLLLASAVLYYRIGEFEGGSGIVWAFASVLVSVVIWQLLRGGIVAVLIGQVALFILITLFRTYRRRREQGR